MNETNKYAVMITDKKYSHTNQKKMNQSLINLNQASLFHSILLYSALNNTFCQESI